MIRPYKIEDKLSLLDLFMLNCPKYFDAAEALDFEHYLDEEREDYFVVEKNKKVIGCGGINYEPELKAAVLSWDIIHPEQQGKGLGRELTEHRLSLIRQKPGVEKVIVRTSQHTARFYEKMGFTAEKVISDYWAPGFDLHHMSKNI